MLSNRALALAAIALAGICFVAGLALPVVSVYLEFDLLSTHPHQDPIVGALYAELFGEPHVYLLWTIRDLLAQGGLNAVFGLLVAVFSVIGPLVKMAVLSWFVLTRRSPRHAMNVLLYVNSWSMLEVFVIAWGIAQLKALPGSPVILVRSGLICLALAIMLSAAAGILYKLGTSDASAGRAQLEGSH